MGLIVKKDVGLGMPVGDAYAQVTPSFLGDRGQWEVAVKIYLTPDCREMELVQQWLAQRSEAVQLVPTFDAVIAKKFGIADADRWEQVFGAGPWDSAADMVYLREFYAMRVVRPIQEYAFYFDVGTPGMPDGVEVGQWKQFLYEHFKRPEYTHIMGIIGTPYLEDSDVRESMRDHVRSKQDVIAEWGAVEPLLLLGLDSEPEQFEGVTLVRVVHDPALDESEDAQPE